MRILEDAAIAAVLPPQEDLTRLAAGALRGLAHGRVKMAPRPTIEASTGVRFMAFPVILEDEGLAGVKWLGTVPGHTTTGRGGATILLSRIDTGRPIAQLDADRITAIRTATVSLLAARSMANPQSRRIAFLACGEQARLHLELFRQSFPIAEVACWSRSLEGAERFAEEARRTGLEARAYGALEDCIAGADIIISSTPAPAATRLRFDLMAGGAFCSLVDLGRSCDPSSLAPGTAFVVDHEEQFTALATGGHIPAFAGHERQALAGMLDARPGGGGVFLPTGLGPVDISFASEILRLYEERSDN